MNARPQSWSINLCKIKGIPLRVHFSFVLILIWAAYIGLEERRDPVGEVLFVLTLFGCVVLHELGHALMARSFNHPTRDIVLYPIGGIATIVGVPTPKEELLIALAGPAVNLIIALILFPMVVFSAGVDTLLPFEFVTKLFWVNVILILFNLLPAYPMDGGRVLRAVLALMDLKHSTVIACRVAQVICVLLLLLGLMLQDPFLSAIAVVVFLLALREFYQERARIAASGKSVNDVMTPAADLLAFQHGTTLSAALPAIRDSDQTHFPIVHSDTVIGVLDRMKVFEASATTEDEIYLAELMDREFFASASGTSLVGILPLIQRARRNPLLILNDGELVGMIFQERVWERLFGGDKESEPSGAA